MVEYNGAITRDYSADRMPQTLTELTRTVAPNTLTIGEGTLTRREINSASVSTATGSLRLTYFTASKSEIISNIVIPTGGTAAAATPTLIRIGLYKVATNGDLTLVASTADDITLFAAVSTLYTKALETPYLKERGQRYAVGILIVTGAATPTFYGNSIVLSALAAIDPRISGQLTSQANLPSSISAGSVLVSGPSYYVAFTP